MSFQTRADWKAFSVPKLGNTVSENEDAFHQAPPSAFAPGVWALSDGATSTSFSRLWAQTLVQLAARSQPAPADLAGLLHQAQAAWRQEVNSRPLPWHAAEKVQQGAFATLLWFSFSRLSPFRYGEWRVVAIGDSCLFHIRRGQLETALPLASAASFDHNPELLASNAARNGFLWPRIDQHFFSGRWQAGDEFFLVTDALAAWCLAAHEKGSNPFQTITEEVLRRPQAEVVFQEWVAGLRRQKALKNDDTTLIWIRPSVIHVGGTR